MMGSESRVKRGMGEVAGVGVMVEGIVRIGDQGHALRTGRRECVVRGGKKIMRRWLLLLSKRDLRVVGGGGGGVWEMKGGRKGEGHGGHVERGMSGILGMLGVFMMLVSVLMLVLMLVRMLMLVGILVMLLMLILLVRMMVGRVDGTLVDVAHDVCWCVYLRRKWVSEESRKVGGRKDKSRTRCLSSDEVIPFRSVATAPHLRPFSFSSQGNGNHNIMLRFLVPTGSTGVGSVKPLRSRDKKTQTNTRSVRFGLESRSVTKCVSAVPFANAFSSPTW